MLETCMVSKKTTHLHTYCVSELCYAEHEWGREVLLFIFREIKGVNPIRICKVQPSPGTFTQLFIQHLSSLSTYKTGGLWQGLEYNLSLHGVSKNPLAKQEQVEHLLCTPCSTAY